MKKLHLNTLFAAAAFLAQPLHAIQWQQVDGHYLSHPEGQEQREAIAVYDWQRPKASLVFPAFPAGRVTLDARHPYQLLPQPVRDWLIRLGAIVPERGGLHGAHSLSIACIVHQPCPEEAFSASERLWYRKGCPPGEAVVLFIPLTQGRMGFSVPADFSQNGTLRASLPNGFVKRIFPFGLRDSTDWFSTRITGADDQNPFAFASLIFCPQRRQVLVSIEIIPPHGMPLNNLDAVEDLLKRFTNPRHPCWQGSQVTVVQPEPSPAPPPQAPSQPRRDDPQPSPSEAPESEPDDFWEDPQERPFPEPQPNLNTWREPQGRPPEHETARHERWMRQRNEWHRQWDVWFNHQQRSWEQRKQRWEERERRRCAGIRARRERVIRYVEHSEQEALASFARSSESSAPPVEAQWAPPPPSMPEPSEDILADVLADVLTEDIERNGDPLLEEILEEDEEKPEPPEEPDYPPQPAPELYLLPRPSREMHLPPRPSDENHPPDPSEVIHHSLRSQMDEIVHRWDENNREYQQLRDRLSPYISRQENQPSDPRCVCTLFGGRQEWVNISYDFSRAIGASFLYRDSNRVEILCVEQQQLHNQARGLWQRSFELYRQEGDRYKQWAQDYNRRVEEYNAAVEREKERINRQVDEFNAVLRSEQERVEREQREWREKVRREREHYEREFAEYRKAYDSFRLARFAGTPQLQEQAERVLESHAAKLLDQTQHEVYQASLFPLPSIRPPRPGGRPRSDSPPPLNDAWIRRAEAKLRIGDHNNFIRTSVRRMLRDGIGLSQRTSQNLGDSADYAVDAAVAYFLGGLSKAGKAAGFAGSVIKAAARKAVGKVEVKLREPPRAEGERGAERGRDFARKQRIQQNLSEQGKNEIPRDIPKRNPNEARNWKRDLLERGRRFYSNPKDFERFEGRVQRADVDHRHELQLGGQDIRNNFTLTEKGTNRSVGAQIQGQTRGRPPGTRVDFE